MTTYDGNRLVALTNGGYPYSAYTYDANGNMTRDGREGLDLSYNMLNLVSQVKDGTTDAIRAEYQWLADGTKLSAVNAAGNGYDYVGSFIYGKSGGISTLESAPFSGGRIVKTSSGYEVNYFLTDHLGSTRVVFSQNLTDLQRNDFYPFGLRIDGLQFGNNRYLYNGKEAQNSLGLSYLDYGARFYDPKTVIMNRPDRFAEKYNDLTPYGYAAGNPLKYVDFNGDSLNMANQYRSEFMTDIKNVFGENASKFSFNESGNLTYSGAKKDFRGDQRRLFNEMNKIMSSSEINIGVAYENTYEVGGLSMDVLKDYGGGLFDSGSNMIVISPNSTGGEVITMQLQQVFIYKKEPKNFLGYFVSRDYLHQSLKERPPTLKAFRGLSFKL